MAQTPESTPKEVASTPIVDEAGIKIMRVATSIPGVMVQLTVFIDNSRLRLEEEDFVALHDGLQFVAHESLISSSRKIRRISAFMEASQRLRKRFLPQTPK